MPKGRKANSKTNSKKKVEEVEEFNEPEEIKPKGKGKKKDLEQNDVNEVASNKKDKLNVEEDDLDSLSELELDELEEETTPAIETAENDIVVSSKEVMKTPESIIDSKTPIGSLDARGILQYLIQFGRETTNPTLWAGAERLLKDLTSSRPFRGYKPRNRGRPRYPPHEREPRYSQQPMNNMPYYDQSAPSRSYSAPNNPPDVLPPRRRSLPPRRSSSRTRQENQYSKSQTKPAEDIYGDMD